jgi:very-short-patch-repair endonuclease
MDFLILLDRNIRVVIEVDGKQHYAIGELASPERYAEMVKEDRRLRLAGYELYRFGAGEFADTQIAGGTMVGSLSKQVAVEFFKHLFERHHVTSK